MAVMAAMAVMADGSELHVIPADPYSYCRWWQAKLGGKRALNGLEKGLAADVTCLGAWTAGASLMEDHFIPW